MYIFSNKNQILKPIALKKSTTCYAQNIVQLDLLASQFVLKKYFYVTLFFFTGNFPLLS